MYLKISHNFCNQRRIYELHLKRRVNSIVYERLVPSLSSELQVNDLLIVSSIVRHLVSVAA